MERFTIPIISVLLLCLSVVQSSIIPEQQTILRPRRATPKTCNNKDQVWDRQAGECRIGASHAGCNPLNKTSTQCVTGASCSNSASSTGTCICDLGKVQSELGECFQGDLARCTKNSECLPYSICGKNRLCSCDDSIGLVYDDDENVKECRVRDGQPCLSTPNPSSPRPKCKSGLGCIKSKCTPVVTVQRATYPSTPLQRATYPSTLISLSSSSSSTKARLNSTIQTHLHSSSPRQSTTIELTTEESLDDTAIFAIAVAALFVFIILAIGIFFLVYFIRRKCRRHRRIEPEPVGGSVASQGESLAPPPAEEPTTEIVLNRKVTSLYM